MTRHWGSPDKTRDMRTLPRDFDHQGMHGRVVVVTHDVHFLAQRKHYDASVAIDNLHLLRECLKTCRTSVTYMSYTCHMDVTCIHNILTNIK